MIGQTRRSLLRATAALTGAAALGAPAALRAQSGPLKIGHLVPLTGFLGSIGGYAQLGIRMGVEELNTSGGIMGRPIELISEDAVNPATASTKAQRMIEQDGAAVLLGEISSASALAIMQVAERNKKVFLSTGARSDALRGKNCNKYSFHCDIPNTVMVNAVGTALLAQNMVKGKRFVTLTADYIFGHDLLKAAKTFCEARRQSHWRRAHRD
jgi:branched-chain amino acid transport system substrate-binding protein